jgi:hypothetical protein
MHKDVEQKIFHEREQLEDLGISIIKIKINNNNNNNM